VNVTVAVPDPPAEGLMLDGETAPAVVVIEMVPVKPLRLVTVTVNEQTFPRRPPVTHVMLPGADTLKSRTTRSTVVECDNPPPEAVTVTV